MAPRRGKERQFATFEHRCKHQYVVEMSTTGIWVIVQKNISFVDIAREFLEHFRRRIRNSEYVGRMVREGLGNKPAICCDKSTGKVMAFIDYRGIRAMNEIGPHFIDNGN